MVSEQMNEEYIFDSYIAGTMDDADKKRFEESLATDDALNKRFLLHREVASAVRRKEMRTVIGAIEQAEQQPAAASSTHGTSFKFVFSIAAVVALLVCCGIGVYHFHNRNCLDNYGNEYLAKAEIPIARGDDDVDLQKIYGYISDGKYDDAEKLIAQYRDLIDNQTNLELSVTQEEYDYRIEMRQKSAYELDWCRALLYMKMHEVGKAKDLLKEISESDSPYSDDAKEILEELW